MISKLRIENVTNKNFGEIPNPCRYCLYWQTTGEYSETMLKPETEHKKEKWLNRVAKAFGNCIKLAHLNDAAIGFIQYAPAKFFPRTREYASGTPSDEAIFIACLHIVKKEERGKGFGTSMLKNLLAELRKGGRLKVETFARKSSGDNPQVLLDST
jgi:GNAT superfamily N-acetyltransferase